VGEVESPYPLLDVAEMPESQVDEVLVHDSEEHIFT